MFCTVTDTRDGIDSVVHQSTIVLDIQLEY